MTSEQKAAFINAQAALLNARVASMQSQNTERERNGCAHAYGEQQWDALLSEFEPILGHNAVIEFFQS